MQAFVGNGYLESFGHGFFLSAAGSVKCNIFKD